MRLLSSGPNTRSSRSLTKFRYLQAEDIEAQEAAANKANKRHSTANQLAQEEVASPPLGEYKHR